MDADEALARQLDMPKWARIAMVKRSEQGFVCACTFLTPNLIYFLTI